MCEMQLKSIDTANESETMHNVHCSHWLYVLAAHTDSIRSRELTRIYAIDVRYVNHCHWFSWETTCMHSKSISLIHLWKKKLNNHHDSCESWFTAKWIIANFNFRIHIHSLSQPTLAISKTNYKNVEIYDCRNLWLWPNKKPNGKISLWLTVTVNRWRQIINESHFNRPQKWIIIFSSYKWKTLKRFQVHTWCDHWSAKPTDFKFIYRASCVRKQ